MIRNYKGKGYSLDNDLHRMLLFITSLRSFLNFLNMHIENVRIENFHEK